MSSHKTPDEPVTADLEREVRELRAALKASQDELREVRSTATGSKPIPMPKESIDTARMEQTIAERSREVRVKQEALEQANSELRDLTENLDKIVRRRTQALVESEEQLRRSNDELKRLNQMKREFVSIAAHELRTPLTSMVGYLELMAEGRFGVIGEKMQRPMMSVRRNAQRLRRLVEEMLDVSRIEGDHMVLKRTRCDLRELGAAVVQELLPLAETKGQRIVSDLQGCPEIDADADKIHQVICNLVSNAIRYGASGGTIEVRVDRAPSEKYSGSWSRVRVCDDGPGIETENLDAIFEPFSDINPAKHHTSGGPAAAGLGLYIARGLVELHEGIITVKSEPGVHTEFAVLLPGI